MITRKRAGVQLVSNWYILKTIRQAFSNRYGERGCQLPRGAKVKTALFTIYLKTIPNIAPEATTNKAETVANTPYSCEKFDTLRGGICQTCPFYQKVTSLVQLGTVRDKYLQLYSEYVAGAYGGQEVLCYGLATAQKTNMAELQEKLQNYAYNLVAKKQLETSHNYGGVIGDGHLVIDVDAQNGGLESVKRL